MKNLHISEELSLALDFVTQTQAILAKRGVGKSYTASVEAEEMLKAGQQVVVIDPTGAWFGLKSSADGKSAGFPIAVFGGEHADVPLEEQAGEVIAQAIVERRFSAILDLSLFRKGQLNRFMTPFLETLYRMNREAMHLIVDEADAIAPQKPFGEEARMLGAMEDVVRRGRRRGIGCTLITQRPAVLNKNVLTQCEILCALRLVHPKDIDAVEEWVNVHADPVMAKEMIVSLPSLPVGTAWFWAPGWGDIFKRVKIRKRETFDSSATPKAGQIAVVPKVLAPIDIQTLGQQIAATIERAKADDPRELRKQIADLKRQMSQKLPTQPDEVVIRRLVEQAVAQTEREHRKQLEGYQSLIEKMQSSFSVIGKQAAQFISVELPKEQHAPMVVEVPKRMPQPTILRVPIQSKQTNGKLRAGAERMLAALVQWSPNGMREGQMRFHAGMKKSGTFSTYMSDLRTGGYIEERGGELFATQEGVDYFGGNLPDSPQTTDEVLAVWEPKLRDGARRILRVLVDRQGEFRPLEEIASESGLTKSGTFSTYLSDLRTARLIVTQRGMAAANKETLFL